MHLQIHVDIHKIKRTMPVLVTIAISILSDYITEQMKYSNVKVTIDNAGYGHNI